jgi:hypothetical protein
MEELLEEIKALRIDIVELRQEVAELKTKNVVSPSPLREASQIRSRVLDEPVIRRSRVIVEKSVPKERAPIELVDYSERSFVVLGDTRSYLEDLKALGGKWNSGLTINDEPVKGWVFSKKHRGEVEDLLFGEE